MLNRPTVDLGFILHEILDRNFSMKNFSDRLKLQKIIYLLQIFNINLGYSFSWYLRGPYCSVLIANGFDLEKIYKIIPAQKIKFTNGSDQKSFKKFLKFIDSKDDDWLEIATSLHYLKNFEIGYCSDDQIKAMLVMKHENFTLEKVNEIWVELSKVVNMNPEIKLDSENTKTSNLSNSENTKTSNSSNSKNIKTHNLLDLGNGKTHNLLDKAMVQTLNDALEINGDEPLRLIDHKIFDSNPTISELILDNSLVWELLHRGNP